MSTIRTRFAPSPTGHLHIGGARTALFNYLIARQAGGTFLLRIEDTDRSRHDESAVPKICADLRWLGIEWDEGIEVGGEHGPYRQSERLDIYRKYIDQLLDEGKAYCAFETSEELAALRAEAEEAKGGFRYKRPDVLPTREEAEKARTEGKPVVVRFRCPPKDVVVVDENFGTITIPAAEQEDFVIQKADGYPTFYLANVVDDALMRISLVCRGQEFLGQTWRQTILRDALGFDQPKLLHLPLIMDMKGRKLSKRDGDVDVEAFRLAGYLPTALVNFIVLLGWNPGGDREKFTMPELIEHFSPQRIGRSNAKFDREKLLAFNTEGIASAASAEPDRLLGALKGYLSASGASIPTGDDDLLRRVLKACKGIRTFADLRAKCDVLFGPDDAYSYDEKAVGQVLEKDGGSGYAALAEFRGVLAACEWTAEKLEAAVKEHCERKQVRMDKVAQPIRVAVTGKAISPPIHDTLLFLGREKALARIDRCLALRKGGGATTGAAG